MLRLARRAGGQRARSLRGRADATISHRFSLAADYSLPRRAPVGSCPRVRERTTAAVNSEVSPQLAGSRIVCSISD